VTSKTINGKREVFDVILSDGSDEWEQAWGLASFEKAAAFSRNLDVPANYTREIRNQWVIA